MSTNTSASTTSYLEVDNPRVLRFRFEADSRSLHRAAANLRRKADELDAAAARAEQLMVHYDDDPETMHAEVAAKCEHWLHTVRCGAIGLRDYTAAQLVRYLVAAELVGDRRSGTWHAHWLFNRLDVHSPCDCMRDECVAAREGVR